MINVPEKAFYMASKAIQAMDNEEFDTMSKELKKIDVVLKNKNELNNFISVKNKYWNKILNAIEATKAEDIGEACCNMEIVENLGIFKNNKAS